MQNAESGTRRDPAPAFIILHSAITDTPRLSFATISAGFALFAADLSAAPRLSHSKTPFCLATRRAWGGPVEGVTYRLRSFERTRASLPVPACSGARSSSRPSHALFHGLHSRPPIPPTESLFPPSPFIDQPRSSRGHVRCLYVFATTTAGKVAQ